MSSGNKHPPPPSYSEATSQCNSGTPQDGVPPEGWVDGYVEAAAVEYHPPAAATDEKPVPPSETDPKHAERGAVSTSTEAPEQLASGRLSFGGLDLGGRVLGYGSGDGVGGWGLKIGPVMLGLVDVEAEKLRREKEGGRYSGAEAGR